MPILDYDMTEDYTNEYSLIEDGDYPVTILPEQEIKDTKTGGKMLVLTYALPNGRKYKDNHNFISSSAVAQSIARANIQSIFDACGLPKNPDTDVLAGKRMVITIGHEMGKAYTNKDGVEKPAKEQNKITAYKRYGATATTVAATPAVTTGAKPNPFAKK